MQASARRRFREALARSEHLTGLGRAKVRFAALEGLAHAEHRQFEEMRRSHAEDSHSDATRVQPLQHAYHYIQAAVDEAQTWFEASNRRILRALDLKVEIENEIVAIGPSDTTFSEF